MLSRKTKKHAKQSGSTPPYWSLDPGNLNWPPTLPPSAMVTLGRHQHHTWTIVTIPNSCADTWRKPSSKFLKTVKNTEHTKGHRMHMTAPFKPAHFLPFPSCLYLWRREIANIKMGFLSLCWKSGWNSVYYIYHGIYRDCFFLSFFLMASPFLLLFVCFILSSFLPFTAAEFKNKFNITDVIRKVLTENIIMLKLKVQWNL